MNPNGLYQNPSGSTPPADSFTLNNLMAMQNAMLPQWQQPSIMSQNPLLQNNPSWQQQQFQNQLPNGMLAMNGASHAPQNQQTMGAFNNIASMIHPNLLQDFVRMSTPVGSSPNDDSILVQVLHESYRSGQTYKQAIDTLHGVNNHAASLWKDYYLDHKPRIDGLVSQLPDLTARTVKKPAPLVKQERKESVGSSSLKPSKRHGSSALYGHSTSAHTPEPAKRRTINSLTTHAPVQGLDNLLPPHADIQIPKAPSQSPSPPTRVVPGVRGNRYTQEDKDFFINFISYELKCNPSLKKNELCEKLAQKAPHHTAQSWASHWHSRHDIADKIFAAAKGDDPDEMYGFDNSDNASESSDEDHETHHNDDPSSKSDSESESDEESDFNGAEVQSGNEEDDERNMGQGGSPYTNADLRVLSRYIASVPNWHSLGTTARWVEFHDRHPQRTEKAWGEYYRKQEKTISRLVKKYRKHQKSVPFIRPQRGRPTWASTSSVTPKRKYSDDGGDESPKPKRYRNDEDP